MMRVFAFCSLIFTAQAQVYTGSVSCRSCHPRQSSAHQASSHAGSLRLASEHPLAESFRRSPILKRGRFQFQFHDFELRAVDEANSMRLPVEWAFGAGSQAVTFVSRVDAGWYVELAYSFYPALRGFALTPGQTEREPGVIEEAVGLIYKTEDPESGIRGCFECHSTGSVAVFENGALQPLEAGVQCEACHGAGSAHLAAPERVRLANPGRQTAAGLNQHCGRCHRPPASDPSTIDWSYAWNVRHQPVYLSQSACFLKSNSRLSCLTCHDAHGRLETRPASYNAKCVSCHKPAAACKTNCVDCHMPRVAPQPPLRFTNHWIGVYSPGAALRPVKR
jgi:hypothetical protein